MQQKAQTKNRGLPVVEATTGSDFTRGQMAPSTNAEKAAYAQSYASYGSDKPATWPPSGLRPEHKLATFAGGCFWSVELAFQRLPGVEWTAAGYSGGHTDNPTYAEVVGGSTGHAEVVQLVYDPHQISYKALVEAYFKRVDPLRLDGQGEDEGSQYRTVVFVHDEEQRRIAQAHNASIRGSVVRIEPAAKFWPAEEYHQQFLEKGGKYNNAQSAFKGCTDPIRCNG